MLTVIHYMSSFKWPFQVEIRYILILLLDVADKKCTIEFCLLHISLDHLTANTGSITHMYNEHDIMYRNISYILEKMLLTYYEKVYYELSAYEDKVHTKFIYIKYVFSVHINKSTY